MENSGLHLTHNDKKVLGYLIEQGRLSDSEAARRLKVSPQAVLKIRHKLEEAGIIEGYKPQLNYKKLGISLMAWVVIKFLPKTWQIYSEFDIRNKIVEHKYVTWACRIPEHDASYILLMGFKNHQQMDRHFTQIQTKLSEFVAIKKIYTFSVDQIVQDSPQELFHSVIDDKDFDMASLFSQNKL